MDGRQKKRGLSRHWPVRSLRLRLSLWLALTTSALALAAGALSFAQAFHEAIEAQDEQLAQVAALLDGIARAAPEARSQDDARDSDARIVLQRLGGAAARDRSGELGTLPDDLADGLQTVTLRNETWRVLVRTTRSGERVAVGQRTDLRDDLATASAWRTSAPLLLLIPLSLLLVALAVNRALAPLAARAAELDRRPEQDLGAIDGAELPSEILPFVVAINRLLRRVATSMDAQTRFVADAAHELRSPLTALSLQAERAAEAGTLAAATERIATLRAGLRRTQQLVEQLLALARAQGTSGRPAPLRSLRDTVRSVIEELLPLADAKAIDLGMVGAGDARVAAEEIDLKTLIGNLVDNAIRYTPPGGRVNVSIAGLLAADGGAARPLLVVEDSGPGIDAAERERVFDPFYRVPGSGAPGSGLGLSIVRTIAARLGAEVELEHGTLDGRPRGLRVTVRFAAATATP